MGARRRGGKEERTGGGKEEITWGGKGVEERSELEEEGRRREDIMVIIKEMEVPWQMGLSPQTVWRLSSNT